MTLFCARNERKSQDQSDNAIKIKHGSAGLPLSKFMT